MDRQGQPPAHTAATYRNHNPFKRFKNLKNIENVVPIRKSARSEG